MKAKLSTSPNSWRARVDKIIADSNGRITRTQAGAMLYEERRPARTVQSSSLDNRWLGSYGAVGSRRRSDNW